MKRRWAKSKRAREKERDQREKKTDTERKKTQREREREREKYRDAERLAGECVYMHLSDSAPLSELYSCIGQGQYLAFTGVFVLSVLESGTSHRLQLTPQHRFSVQTPFPTHKQSTSSILIVSISRLPYDVIVRGTTPDRFRKSSWSRIARSRQHTGLGFWGCPCYTFDGVSLTQLHTAMSKRFCWLFVSLSLLSFPLSLPPSRSLSLSLSF